MVIETALVPLIAIAGLVIGIFGLVAASWILERNFQNALWEDFLLIIAYLCGLMGVLSFCWLMGGLLLG